MNNLKLGQRVIAALGVAVGLLPSSAPSAVLQLEVTYTNGVVDFGPTCPAMPALPSEVCATFTFVGNCCSDVVVAADNALITAHIEFVDATWTEADVEFFEVNYNQEKGGVFGLNYQFFPIDTATVLGLIAHNLPLTITGTCIADGQDFQYTYTNSSSVLTVPCPEDVNGDGVINVLDLIDLLLCFGMTDAPPCDMGQDVNCGGNVNVLDLIELLLVFGTACP